MAVNLKELSLKRLAFACLLGLGLGFILIGLPDLVSKGNPGSLVDRIDNSLMKSMSVIQLLLLPAAGLLWGMLFRWPYAICAAISGVGCLPAIVIMKIIEDPTSHNLWPFEFLVYAFLAVIAALVAGLGVLMKSLFRARANGT
jgi:hypothetical protein